MPLYKYVGNKILTRFENTVVGMDLSEWHSGYRAYSLAALRDVPLEQNDDGFAFDTQIIVQLHEARKRTEEAPIPTYSGDEICYVDGLQSARAYEAKEGDDTSHGRLLSWLSARPRSRILDLCCSDGALAERLRVYGHE